jgi:hypothetical protein
MALDFHAPDDRARSVVLFCLNLQEVSILAPAFETFSKQTGTQLDPYGSGRLNNAHLALLCSLIKQNHRFSQFLKAYIPLSEDLIFEGD